jgi:hypothetical protein
MTNFDVDQLRLQIENLIRENPILEDDEELRADMLEGSTDINAVLTRLLKAASFDRRMVIVLTGEINDATERRARLVRRHEAMRGLMLQVLQSADLKKLMLPLATLSQRRGPPAIVGELDADRLPDRLCLISREPSKAAIREALQAGEEVPGLSLSNAPPILHIKPK